MIHRIFWGNWRMNAGLAAVWLFFALICLAILFGGWLRHGETGSTPAEVVCSNQSLNFANPCNSAYVVMRL